MGNERWYRWYGASQAIASMLLVNGYWLLFNLPVLLLALGLIFPSSPRQFLFSLIGLIISFPSILLPATFALFGVIRRWLYYQEPRQAIGGTFWRLYRENYRRSAACPNTWVSWVSPAIKRSTAPGKTVGIFSCMSCTVSGYIVIVPYSLLSGLSCF